MTSDLSDSEIIKFIDDNDWTTLYELLVNGSIKNPDKELINGNNMFHLACIRTETEFIEKVYRLCSEGTCPLNLNIANSEGLPGLHLYYKFGGKSPLPLETTSVCYLDIQYRNLYLYLIDSIELLEKYIASSLEQECLTQMPDDRNTIYFKIINKIEEMKKDNTADGAANADVLRYLKLIENLIRGVGDKQVCTMAIAMKTRTVSKHLIEQKLFYPYERFNGRTALMITVDTATTDDKTMGDVKMVLDAFSNLTESDIDEYSDADFDSSSDRPANIVKYVSMYANASAGRPINTCIFSKAYDVLKILIDYLNRYRSSQKYDRPHDETDEYNATYLHNLVDTMTRPIRKAEKKDAKKYAKTIKGVVDSVDRIVLKYLFKYTDLNQVDYSGYTCAQLVFKNGLWKDSRIQAMLANRKIDLIRVDPAGDNIYSYIEDADKAEFLKVTQTLRLDITSGRQTRRAEQDGELEKIIDVIQTKTTRDYGLFHPTHLSYMTFALYLQDKHPNLFIPQRVYDETDQSYAQYIFNMTQFRMSAMQEVMNEAIAYLNGQYYSYSPHVVRWNNRSLYYVDPELKNILRAQNEADPKMQKRYVMLKIDVMITENASHANCALYDRALKRAWRFESYGLTDLVRDGEDLDTTIAGIFEEVYGKIEYFAPSDYLSNIKFQLAGDEDNLAARNIGDPGGYCMAWCVWFVDMVCTNIKTLDTNYDVEYIMKNHITRHRVDKMFDPKLNIGGSADVDSTNVDSANSNTKRNIYLDYIRQYGHHLSDQRNKILTKIGVSKSGLYNIAPVGKDVRKIIDYYKLAKVEYV